VDIAKDILVAWRRRFHMYPEISGTEKETATFIASELKAMGISVKENIAGYGVLGILWGDPNKKCVAIRADMDALPILEMNDCSYKSQIPGLMHACGHDTHMAMVLGAAKMLCDNKSGGTVKFIFQPREEKAPGGAKDMIDSGVLKDQDVDAVLGTHITNSYPQGSIAIMDGATMALADDFELSIFGKGGHCASPHQTIDTITVAAEAICALQSIHSRRIDPGEPVVLSVGTIYGGTAQNVIPDQVDMSGTLRCMNYETRDKVLEYMRQTLDGITASWGASYKLDYLDGYPPVINDPNLNLIIADVVKELTGAQVIEMAKPMMAGEDFSYYGQEVPSSFFFTGSGSQRCCQTWHQNCFDIEEDALLVGAKVLAYSAARIVSENKKQCL